MNITQKIESFVTTLHRRYLLYTNNLWHPKDQKTRDLMEFLSKNLYNLNIKYFIRDTRHTPIRELIFFRKNPFLNNHDTYLHIRNGEFIKNASILSNIYYIELEVYLTKHIPDHREQYFSNNPSKIMDPILYLTFNKTLIYYLNLIYSIDCTNEETLTKYIHTKTT